MPQSDATIIMEALRWHPDQVAAEQVRYWLRRGLNADEMIQAVTGAKFVTGYTLAVAHSVIADAWRDLQ